MKTLWSRFKKPILFFVAFFILLEVAFFVRPDLFTGPGKFLSPLVTFPVRVVRGAITGISLGFQRYVFLVGVEKENEKLKRELRLTRIENRILLERIRECKSIAYFPVYFSPATWSGEIFPVIGRDASALFDSVLVYTGGKRFSRGTPVLSWQGVVGMVVDYLTLSAKVMLLTNINSAIDVVNSRSGVRGVFKGEGGERGRVEFVPSTRDVKVGDLWVTSGMDGVYPPGISVAVTTSIKKMEDEPFYIIEANPTLDVYSFKYVFIPDKALP